MGSPRGGNQPLEPRGKELVPIAGWRASVATGGEGRHPTTSDPNATDPIDLQVHGVPDDVVATFTAWEPEFGELTAAGLGATSAAPTLAGL